MARRISKSRSALLFGDSHSYAVQRALERRQRRGQNIPIVAYRLLKMKNDIQVGDTSFDAFLKLIRHIGPKDVVLSMIGGNQHAVFSTIRHPQPFDFIMPGDGAASPGVELVPFRALNEIFDSGIRRGDGESLRAIRAATSAQVIHIIPPPPKADNAFIERYHESVFAKQGIASSGVSSPQLRLKFWTLQTRILEKLCAELDIEVMLPPQGAVDENGFLISDYFAKDATHANADYGELLLREIEARLNVRQPQQVRR
jgi:hypothetical protein